MNITDHKFTPHQSARNTAATRLYAALETEMGKARQRGDDLDDDLYIALMQAKDAAMAALVDYTKTGS